jgi:hypothetical protein
MVYPTYQFKLNQAIPSAQRATVLSLVNMGTSILMSFVFPAAAYLRPVSAVYTVTGAVAAVFALAWMIWLPRATGSPIVHASAEVPS